MELDPDMTCSTLVPQATPLCECTCSSISSSGRVPIAGGHAATKHQLDKTSGSLYCVQGDCATLIMVQAVLDYYQLWETVRNGGQSSQAQVSVDKLGYESLMPERETVV